MDEREGRQDFGFFRGGSERERGDDLHLISAVRLRNILFSSSGRRGRKFCDLERVANDFGFRGGPDDGWRSGGGGGTDNRSTVESEEDRSTIESEEGRPTIESENIKFGVIMSVR